MGTSTGLPRPLTNTENCEDLPLLVRNPEVSARVTNLLRPLVVLDTLLGDEEILCNCDERGRLLESSRKSESKKVRPDFYCFQDFKKLHVLFKKIRSYFDKIFCNSVLIKIDNSVTFEYKK